LYSYGFCHIPVSPGLHEIECVTWRPKGNLIEELKTQFIGGSSQLKVSLRKNRNKIIVVIVTKKISVLRLVTDITKEEYFIFQVNLISYSRILIWFHQVLNFIN